MKTKRIQIEIPNDVAPGIRDWLKTLIVANKDALTWEDPEYHDMLKAEIKLAQELRRKLK